jgi:DNA-binding transcriptional LysR family regulator
MAGQTDPLSDLRLSDVLTFLAVQRCGSITGAARDQRVTPSQVSKSVSRLESILRVSLLTRSARGVSVSQEGLRFVPHLQEIVARVEHLERLGGEPVDFHRSVTIAAPSYLSLYYLPRLAAARAGLRIRCLDLHPALIRVHASDNIFDAALTVGAEPLPRAWVNVRAGEVVKRLFASPRLAGRLGPMPLTEERLRDVPFISPIYAVNGQFVSVDDDCPLRHGDRTLGHEVTTIGLALELAVWSEHVVFGPQIAARRFLEAGTLVEVPVAGWDVRHELYVACNADRLLAPDQQAIIDVVRRGLDEA